MSLADKVKQSQTSSVAEEDNKDLKPLGNVSPEESIEDILNAARAKNNTPGVHVGMSSTAGRPNRQAPETHMSPEIPGYYTQNHGVVRLPNRKVVQSVSIRGQFFYPLDSPAAAFLEARLGQGVTKVKE